MIEWILTPLAVLFWNILITGPLWIVNGLFTAIQLIGGEFLMQLIFGVDLDFNFYGLPVAFYGMLILSAFLLVIMFIVHFCTLVFREDVKGIKLLKDSIKNSLISLLVILLIPALFFMFGTLMIGIEKLFPVIFSGNTEYTNLADILYWVGNKNGIQSTSVNNYLAPENIWDWYFLITCLTAICFVIILFFVIFLMIQKIVELFFLFIISPVVTVTMSFDNGKRIMLWKDFVIAKFIIIATMTFGLLLFSYLLTVIIDTWNDLAATNNYTLDVTVQTVVMIAFIIGGGLAMMGFGKMTASFVGESHGIRESLGGMMQIVRLGMMMTTAGAALKAGAGIKGLLLKGGGASGGGGTGAFSAKKLLGNTSNATDDFFKNIKAFKNDFTNASYTKNSLDAFKEAKEKWKINQMQAQSARSQAKTQLKNFKADIKKLAKETNLKEEEIRSQLQQAKLENQRQKIDNLYKKYHGDSENET